MKKLLALPILALAFGTTVFAATPAAEKSDSSIIGSSYAAASSGQNLLQIRRGRQNWRRPRVVVSTRIVRVGFRTFRETIETRYFPNGRVVTRVVNRVRIR